MYINKCIGIYIYIYIHTYVTSVFSSVLRVRPCPSRVGPRGLRP